MKWVCRTVIIMQTLCLNKHNSNPLLSEVNLNVKGSKSMILIHDRGFLSAYVFLIKKIQDVIFFTIKKVSIVNERTYCETKKRTFLVLKIQIIIHPMMK